MGKVISCCNADLFSDLKARYGKDFTKMMIAEKAKESVNIEFRQLNNKFSGVFRGFQEQTIGIINDKKGQLKNIYEQAKTSVNGNIPGGIKMLQQLKGQPIDEFSGYNTLQSKIDGVKDDTFKKIQVQKNGVESKMEAKKGQMISKINQQRPPIQYYDSLPEILQQSLRRQAEDVLKDEISRNKQKIAQEIASQFNPSIIMSLFSQINPNEQLTRIISSAFPFLSGGLTQDSVNAGSIIQTGLDFIRR